MTKRQLELLRFLRLYIMAKGYSPSFDEMREALGFTSKAPVHGLILQLERQGKIRRLSRRARAIEVVEDGAIPTQLSMFSVDDLAHEAKRRNLMLGHVLLHRKDRGDGVVEERRVFREIKPSS